MSSSGHIVLTSHGTRGGNRLSPIHWGALDAKKRGPLIASLTNPMQRNVIGKHGGAYTIYQALSVTSGRLDPNFVPDLGDTYPTTIVGPHPQWGDEDKIVSLDPFGAMVTELFAEEMAGGLDIRPTIAVTQAHLSVPEIQKAIADGELTPDGKILKKNGEIAVTKAAIDPVWYLPGIAKRFGVEEPKLRRTMFEQTGGMFPELVTRPDLTIFLPPIGGITVYIMGDPAHLSDVDVPLACRVHDECNGSDVFGSDICTCRPYLTHGIEVCVRSAQAGGIGLIVYNRKEGRALGEVTKFLVYNARKRQAGGDSAETYFERTECIAGVQDARFQELMPDVFHWLGVRKIHRFVSMSDMKHDALRDNGIDVGERVTIPAHLVPDDAQVEIEAKKAAGYYSDDGEKSDLKGVKGRELF